MAELEELNSISEVVIGCAFTVHNTLGVGFLEKVYENALAYEIRKKGYRVDQQVPFQVKYDGAVVGEYVADLIVDGKLIIELKVVRAFDDVHVAQCLNYLRATGLRLCLLLNFAESRVAIKRVVSSN